MRIQAEVFRDLIKDGIKVAKEGHKNREKHEIKAARKQLAKNIQAAETRLKSAKQTLLDAKKRLNISDQTILDEWNRRYDAPYAIRIEPDFLRRVKQFKALLKMSQGMEGEYITVAQKTVDQVFNAI